MLIVRLSGTRIKLLDLGFMLHLQQRYHALSLRYLQELDTQPQKCDIFWNSAVAQKTIASEETSLETRSKNKAPFGESTHMMIAI